MRASLFFNVNGKDIELVNPDARWSLASYLRNKLGLNGCKLACEEGVCGSCTVVVAHYDHVKEIPVFRAVNACLFPMFMVDGLFVITTEGIGSTERIHQIQDRIARGHGTQCGFCSPGFVMSTYALLRNNRDPSIKDIDQAVKGNLCRCTGYRPILEALYSFSSESCCQSKKGKGCPCKEATSEETSSKLLTFDQFPPLDESQELIFPASLKLRDEQEQGLHVTSEELDVILPDSMEELKIVLEVKSDVIIMSSGLLTMLKNSSKREKQTWISLSKIPRFHETQICETSLFLGSALSLLETQEAIYSHCSKSLSKALKQLFDKYSSQQVFNVASWTGSLVSPASDFGVFCHCLRAQIHMMSRDWTVEKKVRADDRGELIEALRDGFIITQLELPLKQDHIFTFKATERPSADTTKAIVTSIISPDKKDVRFSVGVGKKIIELPRLVEYLQSTAAIQLDSKELDDVIYEDLNQHSLTLDLTLYTRSAVKKVIQSAFESSKDVDDVTSMMKSTQIYEKASKDQVDGVGRPLAHMSSDGAVTGEAVFVTDIDLKDMAHLGFVLTTIAKGKIINVDASEALQLPGVLGMFDVKDIPSKGTNQPGRRIHNANGDDTLVFVDKQVESRGQIVAVIAATSEDIARKASSLVKVQYEETEPIITMEEAIEQKSYLGDIQHFGEDLEVVKKELDKSEKVIEGVVNLAGQEHMYMETQASVAVPGEKDECTIYCSTQAISLVQLMTSHFLGVQAHNITVKVKRIGGAFGGKTNSSVAIAVIAALVSKKLKRPVKGKFTRKEDCLFTGKRHPARIQYRVGYTSEGKLQAAHLKTYMDGGYSEDNTLGVTALACMKSDCVYLVPHMHTEGYPLKTNKNTNTAFRGYGMPQAYYGMECIMNHIAFETNKRLDEIKEINFNDVGGVTLSGAVIMNDVMVECFKEVKKLSNFDQKRREVEEFNKSSKHKKRGIALSTTRFSLTHPGFMEQAISLVQIFIDGSVTVSIGGVEMGQGLCTKCVQIASRAFKIPVEKVTIQEVSTDKVANSTETGGSQGADLHGRAILLACQKILVDLQPYIDREDSWEKAVAAAYFDKKTLQACEQMTYNRAIYDIPESNPTYFTTGACCVVAEVDVLSGHQKLLSVDIVMDLGQSLNPAIDIGQIEGAFMQGYGLYTCEEVLHSHEDGHLITDSLSSYKIPSASMVPDEFRVKLLKDGLCYKEQVYSSKGVGEPPLLLCTATYSAIRQAIQSRLDDMGKGGEWVQIDAPLTTKKILKWCS